MKKFQILCAIVLCINHATSQNPQLLGFGFYSLWQAELKEDEPLANQVVLQYYPNKSDPNEYVTLDILNLNSIVKAKFDPTKPTKVLIDDFTSEWFKTDFSEDAKNAYLRNPINQNVLVLNWTRIANVPLDSDDGSTSCETGTRNAWIAGGRLAEFLVQLRNWNLIELSRTHLVGMGAGAHIAGRAGSLVLTAFAEPLKRITALDPLGPKVFACKPNFHNHVLRPNDAGFIDVYHTDMPFIGKLARVGSSDIYINGGIQYECKDSHLSCHHKLAAKFWVNTIGTTGSPRDEDDGICATSEQWVFGFQKICEKKIRIGEYATLKTATFGESYVTYNITTAGAVNKYEEV